jgi:hypothetical protein
MNKRVTLPLPAEELRGKHVEFRIRVFKVDPLVEMSAEGEGVLCIDSPDENGLYEAVIHSESFDGIDGGPGRLDGTFFHLDQITVDYLRILEGGTIECFDTTIQSCN